MNITALGDAAHTVPGTGGMVRRHQTKVGHEVGCGGKARRVANGRRQAGAGDRIQTAQRTQVLHQWEQRPGRDLRAQIAINTIPPLFTQTYRLNAFLQHDLLRWLSKILVGQPSSMRLGPSLPAVGIDPLVTEKKSTQLLTSGAHRPHRRQTATDTSLVTTNHGFAVYDNPSYGFLMG